MTLIELPLQEKLTDGTAMLRDIAEQKRPLTEKLDILRNKMEEVETSLPLENWGFRVLDLEGEQLSDWAKRVWWGLMAGELVRAYLMDSAHAEEALSLVEASENSNSSNQRRIRVGLRLGPPRVALVRAALNSQGFVSWAEPNSVPDWIRERSLSNIHSPRRQTVSPQENLDRTMDSIADGATFFTELQFLNSHGRNKNMLGRGLPINTALVKMLGKLQIASCLDLVLWKQQRLSAIELPLAKPEVDISIQESSAKWFDEIWEDIKPILRSSPENLRFLLFEGRGAIASAIGLRVNTRSIRFISPDLPFVYDPLKKTRSDIRHRESKSALVNNPAGKTSTKMQTKNEVCNDTTKDETKEFKLLKRRLRPIIVAIVLFFMWLLRYVQNS